MNEDTERFKNMSAGNAKTHFIQDAAEQYIVFKLQKHAESIGVATSKDSNLKEQHFVNYINERGIVADFHKSIYKSNVDGIIEQFVKELCQLYPGMTFDFQDMEAQGRNENKKGDFKVLLSDGTVKNISLKNYEKGFARPQMCSGTWNSLINNFIFEQDGVGCYKSPIDGSRFRGSNIKEVQRNLNHLGFGFVTEMNSNFNIILNKIKDKYVYDEKSRMWFDIEDDWKKDCANYGLIGATTALNIMKKLPEESVKERVLTMTGLCGSEELLLIAPNGKMLFSATSKKFQKLLKRVNDKNTSLTLTLNGKNIKFTFVDNEGDIIDINIPFTLQKNGAWLLNEEYEGLRFHKKEGVELAYGERRPKKSKQINTSVNTYLELQKSGVC
jgi:hypothetical protein